MNRAVIGLGFGDEGKGLVIDWLCSQSPNLVVRFNGGHQAGHTVVDGNYRHVFSNFGSGTLKKVPTYWSKFCTVEPRGLLKEFALLKDNGYSPRIYIDNDCPITTPYDMWHNQSNAHHGSVGVGFGSTIAREEKFLSLTFRDLFYEDVFVEKFSNIRAYYGIDQVSKPVYTEFLKACCDISNHIDGIYGIDGLPVLPATRTYEGAQGLLLDQHYGFFPNVTRSNTGTKNILELCDDPIQYYLVTRAYQTRHGKGFMSNENLPHKIRENDLETNKEHHYQGKFRRSLLDVSLLEYAIQKDNKLRSTHRNWLNLVITCLDHIVDDYKFTYHKKVYEFISESDFVQRISEILGIDNVYLSHGDQAKDIIKYHRKVSSVGRASDR